MAEVVPQEVLSGQQSCEIFGGWGGETEIGTTRHKELEQRTII